MELLATILFNIISHRGLALAVAEQTGLSETVVSCALCGCEDSLAVTATCRFLDEACICEVQCASKNLDPRV